MNEKYDSKKMKPICNGLQHIGIGVSDMTSTVEFYSRVLGFRFHLGSLIFHAEELRPMMGRAPRLHIVNLAHPAGGPTLEFFLLKDGNPAYGEGCRAMNFPPICELGLAVSGAWALASEMSRRYGISILKKFDSGATGETAWKSVLIEGPDRVRIRLMETSLPGSVEKAGRIFGICHMGVNVSNLEKASVFYSSLGFNLTIREEVMAHPQSGNKTIVRTLGRASKFTSALSSLDGGQILLFPRPRESGPIPDVSDRFGTPGITEIGLDVDDVDSVYQYGLENGARPLVPPRPFDWGWGPCGKLAYAAGPDGAVLEFVRLDSSFHLPPKLLDLCIIRPMRWLNRKGVL
ncbi:MAG: hypothetical protein KKC20_21015 [Proteobacteria bacterium]|nr:hypothetical protein [Pseudomonadota bacterium]